MANEEVGFLLAGQVLFKEFGTNEGFVELGNTVSLTYSTDGAETKRRLSRKVGSYNQIESEVHLQGTSQVAMTSNGFNKDNLTLLFLGVVSDLTVVAASVTAESVDLVENKWVRLANRNITDGTVAIATKIEGTDFLVNYLSGLMMALNASTAGTQSVDYDHGGITGGYEIKGAKRSSVRGELLLIGRNLDDQHDVEFDAFDVSLMPEGDFDFLSSDFGQLQLKGGLKIPSGKDSPFSYVDLTALS